MTNRPRRSLDGLLLASGATGAIALLLAATGQYLVAAGARPSTAALAYAAALASFLVAYLMGRLRVALGAAGQSVVISPLRLVTALAAGTAHAAALALIATGGSLLGLVAGLWLVSLGLAVVAVMPARWPESVRRVIRRARLALACRRAEVAAVGAVVAVGGLVRLIALEHYPTGVHGDEAEFGLIALSILRGSGPHPFGTAFLGDPALFVYVEAPFVAVLGQTMTAVRALAAISGTLTLVSLYALVRVLFGPRPAILAAAFLAGAAVHVHFSRVGLNVAQVPLFATLSLLLLWRGHRTGRAAWWLLAGIAAGLGVYFHFAARLLPVVIALFMGYLLVGAPRRWRAWGAHVLLLSLGAAMALSPLVVHLAAQPHQLTEHTDQRLIFRHWDRMVEQHRSADPIAIAWGQVALNLMAFVGQADASQFFTFTGAPLLNGLTAPLAALGTALVMVRLREPRCALVFFWFWVFVLVGGALTIDSPQFHRLLPAVPAAVIGAALVLDWFADTWSRLVAGVARPLIATAVALVPVSAGIWDAKA
ncbi:MAG: glycosyltransferase family 39 protein, partial [Chloroflexota bacterium]|nr:glycosyltransferase family 39 protein [Chloroflexota bacterium]